jgi:hypothetical protein
MSKKLKITEKQLKRLMVLKEQHEGEVEEIGESAAGGVGLSKMMDLTDKLNSMTASYIRQVKDAISENGFGDYQERYDQLLSQLSDGLRVENDEEEINIGGEPQMAAYEPSKMDVDMDTEYEINESINKIKSEFKRFL